MEHFFWWWTINWKPNVIRKKMSFMEHELETEKGGREMEMCHNFMTVNTWESFFRKMMLWCVLQEINFFMVHPRLSFMFAITSTCYINWKTICKHLGLERKKFCCWEKFAFHSSNQLVVECAWHLSCFVFS